jgi:hypothetical protein
MNALLLPAGSRFTEGAVDFAVRPEPEGVELQGLQVGKAGPIKIPRQPVAAAQPEMQVGIGVVDFSRGQVGFQGGGAVGQALFLDPAMIKLLPFFQAAGGQVTARQGGERLSRKCW